MQLFLSVPVQKIIMNGTNPMMLHKGQTKTIICTTSPSRPAASVVWYNGIDSIISNARTVVEIESGDKFVTRSYLTLTGNKDDNGKLIKCEGSNDNTTKAIDITTLYVWCK